MLRIESIASTGSVSAQHYKTGQPLHIKWNGAVIESMESAPLSEAQGKWIAPGLVDLQVNGYGGVDFQKDESITEHSLLQAVEALRRDGCMRFLLTLITAPWPALIQRIISLREIIQSNRDLREAIPGWHIEGPFLSEKDGFRGAHCPEWMQDSSAAHIRELKQVVKDDVVLLTLSPERPGSISTIQEATRLGFVVSFGHTDASPSQLAEAIGAGGRAFTHLANGCPQLLDRHDNILWRVLNEPSLTIGLIPDGIHISPDLFRILHRTIEKNRIYWTTDAMAAAGAPSGRYSLGRLEVEVGNDRVVRDPVTGGFAGSALAPLEGVRRGASMLNLPWQEVWDLFSLQPARLMGLPFDLSPGTAGRFCLLHED